MEYLANPDHENVIIKSVILLAKQLELGVIAESGETIIQQAYLVEADCDIIQGYLFNKSILPMEAKEMILSRTM